MIDYQNFKIGNGQILEGLYADPELRFWDVRAYIYPTTDGYADWSGTKFFVFVSEDGRSFARRGPIVDLESGQAPWATGCAWAPCAAEKDGKYYFYFCGRRKNGEMAIGAAAAPTPEGPFTAMPEPLVTMEAVRRQGIAPDQIIDPSVYEEDGSHWLLFGNGTPTIVQLAEDMMHLLPETMRALQGARDFREAITVFRRRGLYHFTWSCDDTRSEDYHVNYGTSQSLFGPIDYQYPILRKAPEKGVLGTGHHAIAQPPGTERYVIAYHRFATPVEKYRGKEGFYREVCWGELSFGEDGRILPVEV